MLKTKRDLITKSEHKTYHQIDTQESQRERHKQTLEQDKWTNRQCIVGWNTDVFKPVVVLLAQFFSGLTSSLLNECFNEITIVCKYYMGL